MRTIWIYPAIVLVLGATALAQGQGGAESTGITGPPDPLEPLLHWVTRGIEVVGIGIIVFGAAWAGLVYTWRILRGGFDDSAYRGFRSGLGKAILLGLEFLVAADIIGTVAVEPTMESVLVLGGIVLIRTFLSFSLEIEIEGTPPWKRAVTRSDRRD